MPEIKQYLDRHSIEKLRAELLSCFTGIHKKETSIWLTKNEKQEYKYPKNAEAILFDIELLRAKADNIIQQLKPHLPESLNLLQEYLNISPFVSELPSEEIIHFSSRFN